MGRLVLFAAAFALATTAGAEPEDTEVDEQPLQVVESGQPAPGATPSDKGKLKRAKKLLQTPRMEIQEHPLQVSDSPGAPARQQIDEELQPAAEWDFPRKHLKEGGRFADPFLGLEVFPEVSVGTGVAAAELGDSRQLAYQSYVSLSLWALDVKVPVVSSLDAEAGAPSVQFDLKLPFAIPGAPSHRLAISYGAVVQNTGAALSGSSRGQLLYGFGSQYFSATLRGGYGVEQAFTDLPPTMGLLYGATLAARLWIFEPMVEVDGVRATGTRTDRLTVVPGLRFHPGGENLQLGLGALLVYTRGEGATGRRTGGIVDLSYNFL